jgi:hypothetical protein
MGEINFPHVTLHLILLTGNRQNMQSNLRPLPDETPIRERSVTVLLVRGNEVMQAKTKMEKREIAALAQDTDVVLCVWTGKWSSDAFFLPIDRLRSVLVEGE